MTEQQAVELLSEPLDKEVVNDDHIWYYSEPLKRQGDRITSRPKTGFLRFRRCPDESYRLINWKEPDWETMTSHTEKQYQAAQVRVLSQQKKQQTQLENQELIAQRKAEAAQRRAELLILRQKKADEAKQRQIKQRQERKQLALKIQGETGPATAQAKIKGLTPSQKSSRFLIYGGIFIFITAVIIFITAVIISILQGFRYLDKR